MKKYKRYLAAVWFCGSGLTFFILMVQSLNGRYEGKEGEVWGWFLPSVMPTLSLIAGVLVMDALGKGIQPLRADGFLFRLALGLSIAYLVTVLSTVLMQPFSVVLPLEMMKKSHLWLGPMQGLVAASLSAFFVNKGPAEDFKPTAAPDETQCAPSPRRRGQQAESSG
jgi:hypothetical protein